MDHGASVSCSCVLWLVTLAFKIWYGREFILCMLVANVFLGIILYHNKNCQAWNRFAPSVFLCVRRVTTKHGTVWHSLSVRSWWRIDMQSFSAGKAGSGNPIKPPQIQLNTCRAKFMLPITQINVIILIKLLRSPMCNNAAITLPSWSCATNCN